MLLYSAALLAGFLILFKSADYFVIGAVSTAHNFKVSPMIIGLTIVALATSAPEVFVSTASSLQGDAELAVGNAIGSNIANIGMVLGITAMLVPLTIHRELLKKDLPILVFVTLCAGAALINDRLGIWDGVLLFTGLIIFLVRLAREQRKRQSTDLLTEIDNLEHLPAMTTGRSIALLCASLCLLLVSSELVVWSVTHFAKAIGVSQLVVGLTVIAVGTSLPELVVSVTSALRGQPDLALGNIVGSNIFNILAVLTIPSLISPQTFLPELFWRDYAFMFVLTALLVVFAYAIPGGRRIGRIEGGILFTIWVGYLVLLYRTSMGHPY